MGREKGLRCWGLVLVWFPLLLLMDGAMSSECSPSRCGNITNITHPFRLPDDPPSCGDRKYELGCENNVPLLHLFNGTYRVLGINYINFTIRVIDPGLREGNCSSLPLYFLSLSNFTNDYCPYNATLDSPYNDDYTEYPTFEHVVYMKCSDPVRLDAAYVDAAPCVKWESEGEGGHAYAVVGYLPAWQLRFECDVKLVAPIASDLEFLVPGGNLSYADIHRVLSYGFELPWWSRACDDNCPKNCSFSPETQSLQCYNDTWWECRTPLGLLYYNDGPCGRLSKWRIFREDFLDGFLFGLLRLVGKRSDSDLDSYTFDDYNYNFSLSHSAVTLGIVTGRFLLPSIVIARFLCGIVFLSALLIYTCHRRHLSMYENIENFIRLHNLIPIRYSYKELKTMTKGFKNKFGEGGFGTVYKGKLRSGSDVAIKMLGKSKANGQEFISEVATMGRIHHFNVVHLVGFCAEEKRYALIYEFMSNGSLDKYIFSKEGSIILSYSKMYEISLGVARGIAYLHHGCDMQILHFDMKPHNILLDDNFVPKISDFGLAKLYSLDNSIATLTAARGTIGYMAPELFYKNIGKVSNKTDVYSFGMLLMEMTSRRRNFTRHGEHPGQSDFPRWIYDQFDDERDIEMEGLTKEEKDLTKKMFIVSLWCIQLKPDSRPSMNKVIEMLEADDIESLEMPPKPSMYPNEAVLVDDGSNFGETTSTISSHSHSCQGEGAANE